MCVSYIFESKSCTMSFMMLIIEIALLMNNERFIDVFVFAVSLLTDFIIFVSVHESNSNTFRTEFEDEFIEIMTTILSRISRISEMFVRLIFLFFVSINCQSLRMKFWNRINIFLCYHNQSSRLSFFNDVQTNSFNFDFVRFLFLHHTNLAVRSSCYVFLLFTDRAFLVLLNCDWITNDALMLFRTFFARCDVFTSFFDLIIFMTIKILH